MSRFSRFKQTLLFITICFMSYVGLICRVQVLLPANQVPLEKDTARFLDYEHTSAVHKMDADNNLNENMDISETVVIGEDLTLENKSAQDDMLNESDREQSDNSTNYVQSDSVVGSSQTFDTRHSRTVNFVPVGNMYVYGAYLDLRRQGNATVRLLVLRHKEDRDGPVCFTADVERNYTLYAQPYRMCENHGKEYEGWIYSYVLPSATQTLPHQILVVPFSQRQTRNTHTTTLKLKIIPPHTEPHAADIGVCVPPLFGNLNLASIIHFIQMCKVLGADRVFMYMGSGVSSEIKKFLIHHSKRDVSLSVTDWNLPENVSRSGDKVWYHGQLLAIQDCLYRNMASFRFLLFMDLDEMLVPRLTRDWPDMLDEILSTHDSRRSVAAMSFKSVFFDPTRVPQDSGNVVYFQHLHRTVSASRGRNKLMVQPMKVFELGIHHLSKGLWEGVKSVEVAEKVAVLHHYRACQDRQEADVQCDLVTEDRSMLRYKDRLTHLSHPVITDASRLFA